jgi:hypothetical protein
MAAIAIPAPFRFLNAPFVHSRQKSVHSRSGRQESAGRETRMMNKKNLRPFGRPVRRGGFLYFPPLFPYNMRRSQRFQTGKRPGSISRPSVRRREQEAPHGFLFRIPPA